MATRRLLAAIELDTNGTMSVYMAPTSVADSTRRCIADENTSCVLSIDTLDPTENYGIYGALDAYQLRAVYYNFTAVFQGTHLSETFLFHINLANVNRYQLRGAFSENQPTSMFQMKPQPLDTAERAGMSGSVKQPLPGVDVCFLGRWKAGRPGGAPALHSASPMHPYDLAQLHSKGRALNSIALQAAQALSL